MMSKYVLRKQVIWEQDMGRFAKQTSDKGTRYGKM